MSSEAIRPGPTRYGILAGAPPHSLNEEEVRRLVEEITQPIGKKPVRGSLVQSILVGAWLTCLFCGVIFPLASEVGIWPRAVGFRDSSRAFGLLGGIIGLVLGGLGGGLLHVLPAWWNRSQMHWLPEPIPDESAFAKRIRYGVVCGTAVATIAGYAVWLWWLGSSRATPLGLYIAAGCAIGFLAGWALGEIACTISKVVCRINEMLG